MRSKPLLVAGMIVVAIGCDAADAPASTDPRSGDHASTTSTDEDSAFEQRDVDTTVARAGTGTAELVAWASLSGDTFADGPSSGSYIGGGANGRSAPFPGQPVQGFSAVLDNDDGTFDVMSDNGFGAITNSADYHLRVYTIRPDFRAVDGGSGDIAVESFIELHDPDRQIPFGIVNHFSDDRILTGADFDIESFQRANDGTLWFGDEFGPFLIHTDAQGMVLEAPIPLPDPSGVAELRAPENPFNEEISTLRTMNALRAHAQANGNDLTPVVSPWYVMLADGDPSADHPGRVASAGDSAVSADGLSSPASSEIHDIEQLQSAGYQVVPYTINDAGEMARLIALGVDGIISDRPDLLYEVVADHDADGDGTPGDWLDADGRILTSELNAQGHRGARNLRPENTIPAMEAALDLLMNTLEFDAGVTADGVAVVSHDPQVSASTCRLADGAPYGTGDEVLVKDIAVGELQSRFICDKVFRGPSQVNDLTLSPVAASFASEVGIDPYVMPTLDQVFAFVEFYEAWYATGDGASDDGAAVRSANAADVRYNIETKLDPRPSGSIRTVEPQSFVDAVMGSVRHADIAERTFVQSFDWRSLLLIHEQHPDVRTVALCGDFPGGPGTAGTNLQDLDGMNTPWLAGVMWPYRSTVATSPFDVASSGGLEGLAKMPDGTFITMLEKPLTGSSEPELLMSVFDPGRAEFTGETYRYRLDQRGSAIGDFIMFDEQHGLVIEHDDTGGDPGGFRAVYEIRLNGDAEVVDKDLVVDLLGVADPNRLAGGMQSGDVDVGRDNFAFPFITIENVVVIDRDTIGVLNDNNYPFGVGGRPGESTGSAPQPDDNEFIILDLPRPLGESR